MLIFQHKGRRLINGLSAEATDSGGIYINISFNLITLINDMGKRVGWA